MDLNRYLADLQAELADLDPLGLRHNGLTSDIGHGITFLNTQYPLWPNRIDIDRLDMSDCNQCILGQLNGPEGNASGFWVVRRRQGWSDRRVADHGFCLDENTRRWSDYRLLTILWSIEIIEHHLSKVTE